MKTFHIKHQKSYLLFKKFQKLKSLGCSWPTIYKHMGNTSNARSWYINKKTPAVYNAIERLKKLGFFPLVGEKAILCAGIFGYALGDGSCNKSQLRSEYCMVLCGSIEELDYLQKLFKEAGVETTKSLTPYKETENSFKRKKGSDINAVVGGVLYLPHTYAKLFVALGFPVGRRVLLPFTIPDWVYFSKELKRAFLSGLFSADGCSQDSKRFKGVVAEISLLMCKVKDFEKQHIIFFKQLQSLLLDFNIKSTIHRKEVLRRQDKKPTIQLNLYLSGKDNVLTFLREVGFNFSPFKKRKAEELHNYILIRKQAELRANRECIRNFPTPKDLTLPMFESFRWSFVKKIKVLPRRKTVVYDLEIKQTSNFVANNILIHNSATPFRADNKDLFIEAPTGEKIVNISVSDLIKEGYLVRPHIFILPVSKKLELSRMTYQECYDKGIVNNDERNNLIVDMCNYLSSKKLTVLCAVTRVEHGKILVSMLHERFPHIKSIFVHGEDEDFLRKEILDDLRNKRLDIVIATSIYREGIDVRSLNCLLNAKCQDSAVDAYQLIGRVLRKSEDKKFAIVVDFNDKSRYIHKHGLHRRETYAQESEFKIYNCKDEEHFEVLVDDLLERSVKND